MILDITSFHPDPCLACGSCTSIFTSGKVLCSVCSAGSSSLHRWAGNSNRTWMDQARASFIQFHHVSTRLPPIYGEIGEGSFLFYHVLPTLLEFYLTILLLPMSSRSLKSYAPPSWACTCLIPSATSPAPTGSPVTLSSRAMAALRVAKSPRINLKALLCFQLQKMANM